MADDPIQQTRDSLSRSLQSEDFLQAFYDKLMASSDSVRHKFATTDFDRQIGVLRDSLYLMLSAAGTTTGPAHRELEKLGERHSRRQLDIKPEWYELWLDCLLQTVAEYDLEYSAELDTAWRETLRPCIELLKSRY
ncbi:MAG TPA: globin [Vicinamibacteria bacterium]|nr:globin [Vicinamibacteria bacterium]